MNKQAIRKAFFVCASIGIVYAGLAFNIQDRFSMKRTFDSSVRKAPKNLSVAVAKAQDAVTARETAITSSSSSIEPSGLIAVPVVAYAIREGLIEKDGMILVKKTEDTSNVYLKKPFDILKDKDQEGLKTLSRIIGKKNIETFLNREGIKLPDTSLSFDAMAGTGYSVEKNTLIALYNKYVGAGFDPLMPYVAGGFEVARKGGGFDIGEVREDRQAQTAQDGDTWTMPNLTGLSMKAALDKISPRTEVIKIHGSGVVADQYPKPQEKVQKETRCILYGRSYQR